MQCYRCKAENPEAHKYCSECGTPLDPQFGAMRSYLMSEIRPEVMGILREELKERNVVEVETTQAIVSRLLDWSKMFAFFVAIPLGILLLILAGAGIKSYIDV